MPKGLWVKDNASQSYKTVTGLWVKISPNSWVSVADAWVKVAADQPYQVFYTAGTAPDSALEIINTYDSSDRLRLQGVNKHWTPTPTTLQYKFVYVDPYTAAESDITSWTNTTNPSTGSSTTLPGSSSYVTIANGATDPYWYPGVLNVYKFRVRGSTASGLYFTSEAEYAMRTPKAPTLSFTTVSSSSINLTINSYSVDDYIATGRYIVYAYDGTAYRYAGSAGGIVGLGGYAADSQSKTITISGLSTTKLYTFYVLPITGYTGTTDTNTTGYHGLEASIDVQLQATAPSTPVISNITTSTDSLGVKISFDISLTSTGSSTIDYWEFNLNDGGWQKFNSTYTPTPDGYVFGNSSAQIYVSAGTYYTVRVRATNLDAATSQQSNQLAITSAAAPTEPTSVVVKSFNANQLTIFFTAGQNTGSVVGMADYDSVNDFDFLDGYINISQYNPGKIQLNGAAYSSRSYQIYLKPWTGANKTGNEGALTYYTNKTPSGSDKMQISLGAPSRPSDRKIDLSWTISSGAPTQYICNLYTSSGSLTSSKLVSSATSVSFTSADGVQYSTNYYITVQPQYQYATGVTYEDLVYTSTTINSGANVTAPTSTSIVSVARLTDSTCRVYIGSSGGSGPYYQLYWQSGSTAPSTTNYDAASTTSTVMEDFSFSNGITYYFYIRSSSENLGNTVTGGTATAGTYSDYGPTTGAASYTFASPSGGTASVSGSSTVGSTLTLTLGTPSASPAADGLTIIWRRNDGGAGGNSYTGGSIMQYGGTSYTIDSPLVAYSSVGYSIRAEVTWNNGVGSQSVNSNGTLITSAGVAPSGGSVTLTPSGTQMAGTTISANVTAMSGTATISYTTTIRKKTGSAPTSKTDGTEVASGTGTGNGVATHTITDSEASGTPDQFRAFTTGTNTIGSNVVSSNTVISTPYVAPVVTPSGGTATSTPSTGTAGTTTYFGSTSGWSGSPTSYTYSWQYFSQSSFSWVQYTSGTTFSPPSNINSLYPNYGWQLSVAATNSAGTGYATTSITVNTPVVVTVPSTPTGVTVSGSGLVSWDAVSGATSYEVLNYTDRTSAPSNTTNRLGPYTTTGITGTSFQLTSTQGYSGSNNYARAQVRARNSAGASSYSAWYPSSTTYV
jgi:hypothetical protein